MHFLHEAVWRFAVKTYVCPSWTRQILLLAFVKCFPSSLLSFPLPATLWPGCSRKHMKAVNNFTNVAGVSCTAQPGKQVFNAEGKSFLFSPFLSPSLDVPSHVEGPPFSLCSLCSFSLCSPALRPLPCILWYADTQEFLGLKMIDQTCQPWLLLLKMADLAVCAPVIGSCQSYSSCDWLKSVCPQFMYCW